MQVLDVSSSSTEKVIDIVSVLWRKIAMWGWRGEGEARGRISSHCG